MFQANWLTSLLVNMRAIQQGLLLAAALLLLTACSFQLRGNYQLAPQLDAVSLEAPARSEIATLVNEVLTQRNVDVVSQGPNIIHVELHQDRFDRRILSMLTSGQVAEYELIYVLPVTFSAANGDSSHHTIQILRDYQDDPNFALAKTRELELLVTEMRNDAAHRLLLLLNQFALDQAAKG